MSITYYLPRPPVTSLRLDTEGAHDKLSVFVRGKLSGVLVTDQRCGGELATFFRGEPLLHSHYGGDERGVMFESLSIPLEAIAPSTCIIDEYGGVSRVGDLLAKRGAR